MGGGGAVLQIHDSMTENVSAIMQQILPYTTVLLHTM
jgi:hypothetical protein